MVLRDRFKISTTESLSNGLTRMQGVTLPERRGEGGRGGGVETPIKKRGGGKGSYLLRSLYVKIGSLTPG